MELLLATHNEHKKEEIQVLLPQIHTLKSLTDIGFLDEIPETGSTFSENAFIKAKAGYEFSKIPTFSDDSGLVIPALNGNPGVYSARYAGTGKSEDNIKKVLSELENKENREAYFVCVICFYDGKSIHYFEGKVMGQIALQVSGTNGFGYDPIFIPEDYEESFASLPSEVKNSISHRKRALENFLNYISG